MKRKERDGHGNRLSIQNCSHWNYCGGFKSVVDSVGQRRTSHDDNPCRIDCGAYYGCEPNQPTIPADKTALSTITAYGMDTNYRHGADSSGIVGIAETVQPSVCSDCGDSVLWIGFDRCHSCHVSCDGQPSFIGRANFSGPDDATGKSYGHCDFGADCKGCVQRCRTNCLGRTSRTSRKSFDSICCFATVSTAFTSNFRLAWVAKCLLLLWVVIITIGIPLWAAEDIWSYLPSGLEEFVQKAEEIQQFLQQTPAQLFQQGWQMFSGFATEPLRVFIKISIFLLFAAVVATPSQTGDKNFAPLIQMVCFLLCAIFVVQPVQQILTQAREQIFYCKGALMGFVPVFSSMLVAGGQPASAAIFSGFFLSTALFLAEIAATVVLPLIQMLIALHTASGLCDVSVVSAMAQMVQRVVKWGLGLVSTIFVTFLGLQNFLAGASDSLAMKTGKFLISSSIPIVGQAVSSTIGAVGAGIKLARGTAAIGLLVAIAVCFVPVLVQTVLYWWAFSAAATIAKGVEQPQCAQLLKAAAGCTSLCGLTLLFYGLPIVLSVVWMMSVGG